MKKAALFLALVMLFTCFTACSKPENGGQTDDSRVLNLAANHTYQPLDPNTQNSLACKWVWYQVYEGLIYYNNEEHTIEPRVAESWTVSDDELTYTFTLRDGVKFHNGEPVTVEDVVFSFNRAKEGPCYTNHVAAIDTVKAVGDDKVEIKLKHTYAPFWQYLSEIYIMNKNFVNERNGDISDAACGTGPYKIVEADLAVAIKAEAFEDYYRGLAKIKKIVWNIISDSSSAAMALQSGDLDYLEIAWSQVALLEADENLVISPMQSLHTSYLAFNCQNEIFKDVRVRQGISYLLDREEIALMAFEGFAEVDSFVMHPNLAGMPDKSAIAAYDYTYNPEKGLALLKEAGYDTSKGEVYLGSILTLPESHYLFKPAPIIQAQLAKHNIKVNIEPYESGTMFEKLFGGDYVMAICGGSYGSDASGYATVHGSSAMGQLGGCCSYLVDEEMDALFEQGVAEMDPANRGEIYGEIMRILFENCPQTGIGHKQVMIAWRKDLNVKLRLDYPLIYEWEFISE